MIKKIILRFLSVFLLLLLTTDTISADVLPEIPFNSPCKNGVIPVFCEITMKDYSSPPLRNECIKYENNTDFESVSYNKSLNNGQIIMTKQYCPTSLNTQINSPLNPLSYDLLAFAFTLLIEGLVLLFFRYFSNLRALVGFLLVNILSYTSFVLILGNIVPLFDYYLWIILLEVLIIVFEIVLVKLITKGSYRRIIIPFVIANLISATFGTLILRFILVPF